MNGPMIYVDLYQTPASKNPLRRRDQRWRWRARNAHNNQILASGEAYTNHGDALHAINQLFGTQTDIYLREGGLPTLLRQATTGRAPA